MKTSPSLGVVVDRPWRAGPSLRRLLLPLAAAALGLGSAAAPAAPEPGGAGDGPLARVIVKYKAAGEVMRRAQAARAGGGQAAHGPQQAAAMGLRSGLHLIDGRVIDERRQVLLARGLSSQELALRLAADAELEYAVPDERRRALALPNDPLFAGGPSVSPIVGQWYLRLSLIHI